MAFDSAKTSGKCTDTPALRIPRYTTSESSGWLGYDLLGQKVLLSDDDVIGRNVVFRIEAIFLPFLKRRPRLLVAVQKTG
jgi:hypothetical protein